MVNVRVKAYEKGIGFLILVLDLIFPAGNRVSFVS